MEDRKIITNLIKNEAEIIRKSTKTKGKFTLFELSDKMIIKFEGKQANIGKMANNLISRYHDNILWGHKTTVKFIPMQSLIYIIIK